MIISLFVLLLLFVIVLIFKNKEYFQNVDEFDGHKYLNVEEASDVLRSVEELNNYVQQFKSSENLVFVTHYVLISEVLNYAPSSGEIVVSDKNYNMIGSIEINY